MNISVSQAQGKVPVTVIKLDGQLDGQTYQGLIAKAREVYDSGARDFLIDLLDLTYISSAGLLVVHGRHRLGHRTLLHRLWPAVHRRHQHHV